MPFPLQPVLADLGTIIQAIIFLVILASGVAKMFRESKEVQKRAERPRPQPRRAPDPLDEKGLEHLEPQPQQRRQAPQEEIRSEVEEFLRRVKGEEQQPKPVAQKARAQTPPPRQARTIEVADDGGFGVDERPRSSHRRSQQRPPKPVTPPLTKPAEPAASERKGIDSGESVADYVAQHLERPAFAERASHLGEDIAQSDERLEARLQQTFDHGLGSLSARRKARVAADEALLTKQDAPDLADRLLTALSTPEGVQQAVILNEVLQRPTDRW